jgi:hypothetical protein
MARPRKRSTAATTVSMNSVRARLAPAQRWLNPGDVIESPETRLRYDIERLIGAGGFGQAFLARRKGRSTRVAATVCIKISPHIDGWLREAYFGQLLEQHPRAIRVYGSLITFIACSLSASDSSSRGTPNIVAER